METNAIFKEPNRSFRLEENTGHIVNTLSDHEVELIIEKLQDVISLVTSVKKILNRVGPDTKKSINMMNGKNKNNYLINESKNLLDLFIYFRTHPRVR